MQRRSFLASLAALLVARKLPAVPTHPFVRASTPAIGDIIEIRDAIWFDRPMPGSMSAYIRFTERGMFLPDGTIVPVEKYFPSGRMKVLPGIHTLAEMRALP